MSITLNSLRDYVRLPSSQNQSKDTILIQVTHSNLQAKFQELRFDLQTTIYNVKERLRTHTGTLVDSMHLQLLDCNDVKICDLLEDERPLGFYSPLDGYGIHVIDLDPTSVSAGGWLEDTSLVEKYEISEESYNKRDDTFRKFKEKRLAQDPIWTLQKEMAMRRGDHVPPEVRKGLVYGSPTYFVKLMCQTGQWIDDNYMADMAKDIKVGDRCEVDPSEKRGEVKFVGRAKNLAPGFWIGVQLDEPVGKHDGMYDHPKSPGVWDLELN